MKKLKANATLAEKLKFLQAMLDRAQQHDRQLEGVLGDLVACKDDLAAAGFTKTAALLELNPHLPGSIAKIQRLKKQRRRINGLQPGTEQT